MKDFLFISLTRVFSVVTLFAYSVVMARFFGAEAFALVLLYLNFCTLASFFLTAGYESGIVRFGSSAWACGDEEALDSIYAHARNTILRHLLLLFFAFLVFFSLGVDTRLTSSAEVAGLTVAGAGLVAFSSAHRDVLRSSGRVIASMLSQNIVRAFVPLMLTAALIIFWPNLRVDAVNITLVFAGLVCGLAFEIWAVKRAGFNLFNHARPFEKIQKQFVRRVFVGDIAHITLARFPAVFVGLYFDLRLAALFLAAERIAAMSQFVTEGVQIATGPSVAIAGKTGGHFEIQSAITRASLLAFLSGVPIILVLIAVGQMLLAIFGASFVEAYPALAILVAGYGIMAVVGPTPMYANMLGLESERATTSYVALAVAIVGLLFATWSQSIVGAALSVAFALTCLYAGLAYVIWRKAKVVVGPLGLGLGGALSIIRGELNDLRHVFRAN